jgi:hypothetical protein
MMIPPPKFDDPSTRAWLNPALIRAEAAAASGPHRFIAAGGREIVDKKRDKLEKLRLPHTFSSVECLDCG